MKICGVLLVLLLGGCSVLDSAMTSSGFRYDPTKIYLGPEPVSVSRKDIDRYACVERVLICRAYGTSMDCRCVW